MFGLFKHQRGLLPFALVITGGVAILFSGILLVLVSPEPKPILLRDLEIPNDFELRILLYLSTMLLFFLGLYLTSIFPRILITRGGLTYLGFILYFGHLRWNEIDNLIELKNGTILISINPRRFFLFKGMLFQRLTGVLLGHKCPVLLLAPGLELRDQIIEEIMAKSLVKKVHNTFKDEKMNNSNVESYDVTVKHSPQGIISVILGVAALLILIVLFIFPEMGNYSIPLYDLQLIIIWCLFPVIWLAGLILAIVGLVKKGYRRTLPIIGIILNILIFCLMCLFLFMFA
jgi:hypothetical protein